MEKIIARIDFTYGDDKYIAGDKVEINDINAIRKLNEQGFIEPLDYRDLVLIERELEKQKNEL